MNLDQPQDMYSPWGGGVVSCYNEKQDYIVQPIMEAKYVACCSGTQEAI